MENFQRDQMFGVKSRPILSLKMTQKLLGPPSQINNVILAEKPAISGATGCATHQSCVMQHAAA